MAASGDRVQAFPVAWPYGPYGYPYAYPAFFDPWFGPVATLGFFGTVGPGFQIIVFPAAATSITASTEG